MKANSKTEEGLRAEIVGTPESIDDLIKYIESLKAIEHDYGTCVYAMSMAAVAAFNYMASHLGVTDFQASCADLDIIRRTRGIDSPFMIQNANDMLYPQYDLREKLETFMSNSMEWASVEAQKKLNEVEVASKSVVARWSSLASGVKP